MNGQLQVVGSAVPSCSRLLFLGMARIAVATRESPQATVSSLQKELAESHAREALLRQRLQEISSWSEAMRTLTSLLTLPAPATHLPRSQLESSTAVLPQARTGACKIALVATNDIITQQRLRATCVDKGGFRCVGNASMRVENGEPFRVPSPTLSLIPSIRVLSPAL